MPTKMTSSIDIRPIVSGRLSPPDPLFVTLILGVDVLRSKRDPLSSVLGPALTHVRNRRARNHRSAQPQALLRESADVTLRSRGGRRAPARRQHMGSELPHQFAAPAHDVRAGDGANAASRAAGTCRK